MTGQTPVTLHQVAKLAGVSIATVSRVVRGVDRVMPETQQRVREAIEILDYRPSHFGQALVNRRHGAIGIVLPGLRGPYYSELVHGFEEVAIANRQALLVLGTHLLHENHDQVLALADRSDGIAVTGGAISDRLLRKLAALEKRVVLMAQHQEYGLPTVRVDNYHATRDLVRHLIADHGYRDLVFIGNIDGSPDPAERWLGFVAAHREAELAAPAAPLELGMEEQAGTYAANQLLSSAQPPRAIVCANDELAMGVLSVAHSRGLRVPDDLAITGFDDIPFARYTAPPLTTIRQPARELAARAATILLQPPAAPVDLCLPTEVVIRASCGCGHPGTLIDNLTGTVPHLVSVPSATNGRAVPAKGGP